MNWNNKTNARLIQSILSLKSADEAQRFLRDLMTEKEIDEFAKRLQAAEMLTDKVSYLEIAKTTGLSSTTIARVAKWLNGKGQGYRSVLAKMHHTNPSQIRKGLS